MLLHEKLDLCVLLFVTLYLVCVCVFYFFIYKVFLLLFYTLFENSK